MTSSKPSITTKDSHYGLYHLGGLICGLLIFIILIWHYKNFSPEDAALEVGVTPHISSFEGERVSYRKIFYPAFNIIKKFKAEGYKVVLWMGASQLHSIVNYTDGDDLAIFYANKEAKKIGSNIRYVQVSLPNGNLNEFLAVYLSFRAAKCLPDTFCIGMLYDDLRETGIRKEILNSLPVFSSQDKVILSDVLANFSIEKEKNLIQNNDSKYTSFQQKVEDIIVQFIEKKAPLYHLRGHLRAKSLIWIHDACAVLIDRMVYIAQKTLFSLGASQKTVDGKTIVISKENEQWNMAALNTLIKITKSDN
ncbi:hypothetical protein [Desulfovibrio sp. UCD-KL4C]|uniref:hypothetical protein n=1 Tax=Desulfovibrio sp. UCD-KL4C TaxID=2578120 RepID=UPI0025BC7FC2|nr:hypothetical protein [Desulfovibrio sp. UCD-KL4C]